MDNKFSDFLAIGSWTKISVGVDIRGNATIIFDKPVKGRGNSTAIHVADIAGIERLEKLVKFVRDIIEKKAHRTPEQDEAAQKDFEKKFMQETILD